jgi:hypothetical protein
MMAHLINLLHGDEWSVDEKCFRFLDFCAFLSWPYFCWCWTKTGLVSTGKLTWILKVITGYFHFFLFFYTGFHVANCRKFVWTLQQIANLRSIISLRMPFVGVLDGHRFLDSRFQLFNSIYWKTRAQRGKVTCPKYSAAAKYLKLWHFFSMK